MAHSLWRRPGRMVPSLLRSLFRRPATTHYPFVTWTMPDDFRGRPVVHTEGCIGCRMCVRNCPSGAIQIEAAGEKRFEAHLDLGRCLYCGRCAEVCPKKTIEMTKDFELASLDRNTLKVVYDAPPPPAAPASPPPSSRDDSKPSAADAGT